MFDHPKPQDMIAGHEIVLGTVEHCLETVRKQKQCKINVFPFENVEKKRTDEQTQI